MKSPKKEKSGYYTERIKEVRSFFPENFIQQVRKDLAYSSFIRKRTQKKDSVAI